MLFLQQSHRAWYFPIIRTTLLFLQSHIPLKKKKPTKCQPISWQQRQIYTRIGKQTMFPTKQNKSFFSLFEPRAAIETSVIHQDTYFSYICKEVGTFCVLFPKKINKQLAATLRVLDCMVTLCATHCLMDFLLYFCLCSWFIGITH